MMIDRFGKFVSLQEMIKVLLGKTRQTRDMFATQFESGCSFVQAL